MKNISLIAACDKNGCIGRNNKLPWKCRSEMEHFLKRVAFKPLIMGKNTCLSLYKPINSAINYVLTSDKDFHREGFTTVNSMEEMLSIMEDNIEYCVVGGEKIYKQFLELVHTRDDVHAIVELSRMQVKVENGDAFFPLDMLEGNDMYRTQIIYKHNGSDMSWYVEAYYRNRIR